MIRGILFDKDGTLIDFAATWEPLYRATAILAARGDEGFAERLLMLGGANASGGAVAADSLLAAATTREIAEAWIEAGARWAVADLTATLDARFQAGGLATMKPVTDLHALFVRLKARGLRLGIASSDSAAGIAALVERCDLGGQIDFIAGWDSVHGAKPAPGMVHAFAAATGLGPSEIAVVGDNRHDMLMGASAGAGLRVGVLTGTGTRATLSAAAHVVLESIEHLEATLDAAEA
jgi:phosphoglycolate phosphatase